jgi:hypothetical protein
MRFFIKLAKACHKLRAFAYGYFWPFFNDYKWFLVLDLNKKWITVNAYVLEHVLKTGLRI